MKLLALILAYIISHFISQPERFRRFEWYNSWTKWLIAKTNFDSKEILVILIVGLPVVFISSILLYLFNSTLGGLIIAILVLSYCIGPKSFEEDVESGDIKSKLGIRKNAKTEVLIKKLTQVALTRWFGVFFWYMVLGIVGALLYRLSDRLHYAINNGNELKPSIDKLMQILNYPVSWMMVISLAIASDFERIYQKCKPFMNLDNVKSMDNSFLYEATDFAVENCEIETDEKDSVDLVTLSVLKRMLVVWLVVVSILVIFAV